VETERAWAQPQTQRYSVKQKIDPGKFDAPGLIVSSASGSSVSQKQQKAVKRIKKVIITSQGAPGNQSQQHAPQIVDSHGPSNEPCPLKSITQIQQHLQLQAHLAQAKIAQIQKLGAFPQSTPHF